MLQKINEGGLNFRKSHNLFWHGSLYMYTSIGPFIILPRFTRNSPIIFRMIYMYVHVCVLKDREEWHFDLFLFNIPPEIFCTFVFVHLYCRCRHSLSPPLILQPSSLWLPILEKINLRTATLEKELQRHFNVAAKFFASPYLQDLSI